MDFVLDLQHTPRDCSGQPSSITELLERYNVQHAHAGMKSRTQCEDKLVLPDVVSNLGVLSPPQIGLTSQEILSNRPLGRKDIFPAFLKPRKGQGNFGICEQSFVESEEALLEKFPSIHATFPSIEEWVLQKYLSGLEYTVAVVGNGEEREILPVATLKWDEGRPPFKVFDPQNIGGLKPENPNYRLFCILFRRNTENYKFCETFE